MFVLLRIERMQLRNHVDTQPMKRSNRYAIYIHHIKFGMLEVRENEISLRKLSGGTAQLRNLAGTLLTNHYD